MKGDILEGSKREREAAYHFIVHLEGDLDDDFKGAVLTHSNQYQNNILMRKECFEECNEKGEKYKFIFNNTYLVKMQFIKLKEWGPFKKIGKLTKEGIAFVGAEVSGHGPMLWDSYIEKSLKLESKSLGEESKHI